MESINSLSPKTPQTPDLEILTLLFLAIMNCGNYNRYTIDSPVLKDPAKASFTFLVNSDFAFFPLIHQEICQSLLQ